MTRLEDPAVIAAGDPSGILRAFLSSGDQLRAAYELGLAAEGPVPRSVALCGMGGSAAGADVAAAALDLAVPIVSVRGYVLPPHVGPEDLVVCLSFSGGTEETLACHDEAARRGARVVAITSGGALADRAETVIRVPAGVPMPRAGLGYLAGAAIGALEAAGLAAASDHVAEASDSLATLAKEIAPEAPGNEAMEIAEAVGSRVPVVWGSEGIADAAAFRWKAAWNENAKVPAFASALPELSHHEVEGWSEGRGSGFLLAILRHPGEHPSVARRLEATLPEIEASGLGWREVHARGEGRLARMLSLILVGDLASTYHAIARRVDPTPIPLIARVKERLGP